MASRKIAVAIALKGSISIRDASVSTRGAPAADG
jgi:hypothetical protein